MALAVGACWKTSVFRGAQSRAGDNRERDRPEGQTLSLECELDRASVRLALLILKHLSVFCQSLSRSLSPCVRVIKKSCVHYAPRPLHIHINILY